MSNSVYLTSNKRSNENCLRNGLSECVSQLRVIRGHVVDFKVKDVGKCESS